MLLRRVSRATLVFKRTVFIEEDSRWSQFCLRLSVDWRTVISNIAASRSPPVHTLFEYIRVCRWYFQLTAKLQTKLDEDGRNQSVERTRDLCNPRNQ